VSFHKIEEELRSQYALTYTPADFKYDGRFRPFIFSATTAAIRRAPARLLRAHQ